MPFILSILKMIFGFRLFDFDAMGVRNVVTSQVILKNQIFH